MNKIPDFNSFLFEANEFKNAFKNIDIDKCVDLMVSMWPSGFDFDYYRKNLEIFKGLGDGSKVSDKTGFFVFNGYTTERISPNTQTNFYNIFFSNDKSWSKFPKRNKSLICTTNLMQANSYGEEYFVIPGPDTLFGRCSGADIWYSFKHVDANFSLPRLDDFITVLMKIKGYERTIFHSWSKTKEFMSEFENLSGNELLDMIEGYEKTKTLISGQGAKKCLEIMYDQIDQKHDLYKKVVEYLEPKRNGMSVDKFNFKTKTQYLPMGSEIWFENKAILVTYKQFENFKQLYLEKIK